MMKIPGINLPLCIELQKAEKNILGETNDVYNCEAKINDKIIELIIKVAKKHESNLKHEYEIIKQLKYSGLPISDIIAFDQSTFSYLALSKLPGHIIWDFIDNRRVFYKEDDYLSCLENYGKYLGKLHSLSISVPSQKRQHFYDFIGEENVPDERFVRVINWLRKNDNCNRNIVFTHGDYNTANVLIEANDVSGIVDWEFAGMGWREYDIAWMLRARQSFQNSIIEKEAMLKGYREYSEFDKKALDWCEVMNYLHFAFWYIKTEPDYAFFAFDKAGEIINS